MFTIKVLESLKSLTPEEFKDFGKYLNSPIHNSTLNLISFYDLIKKYYPEFPEKKLNSTYLFGKVFEKKPFDIKLLSRLSADMTEKFEDFLILIEQNKEVLIKQKFLLSQLLKRKLYRQFEEELEHSYKILNKIAYKDEDYYLNKFFIETLKKEFLATNNPITKMGKEFQKYSEQVDNLIYFFVIIMLKEYLHIHSRKSSVNYEVEFKFYNEIMSIIAHKPETYKNERLIFLLSNFLKIYDETYDEGLFKKLREILKENEPFIKRDVYNFLIIDLFNYCMNQDEAGRKIYQPESIKLMNEMLENDVLIRDDGYISGYTYRNLQSIALRFNRFDWAKNFIENYKNRLPPDDKDNSYRISLATLYSRLGDTNEDGKEDYLRSLQHLNNVKTEDYSYMTRLKNLQIHNYYYLGDFESIISILDSFKHYLHANKQIPHDEKIRMTNYIKSMNKLIKIIHGSKTYTLHGLKHEILNYQNMGYKNPELAGQSMKPLLLLQGSDPGFRNDRVLHELQHLLQ
jgi:hypothetical protein